ncbi:type VI secretion system baseplate subunit TssG [Paraburkholderia sp. SIMBA_027]|uniref:type VI secretion system baseplate subunit TssG n=2 Tax=Pseudomonadota TaxID=1224 RepID=UPI00397A3FFD
MDGKSRKLALSLDLIERLQEEPWNFGFLALMRRINANGADDPVGTALLPTAEPFRVGQKPSLTFAPREIADAKMKRGRLHTRLYSLGMLGPNGPLPLHVSEIAREREELRRDPTLSNFLDIFHHRALTLFYRAWASAQATASLDRPDDDRFSFYISCLSGHSALPARTVSLPTHAYLASSPHLVHEARNLDALSMSVAWHFGVPVHIEPYAEHWIELPEELHCRMGEEGDSACLGLGATLGGHVLSRRHRFCMVVGPLATETYHRFTPRGEDLLRLVAWVRAYVGLEYEWLLELQIQPDYAPPAVLGEEHQLGWSSWLGQSPDGKPVIGMRFEPEAYLDRLVESAAMPEEVAAAH